jgi:hypothetical protein
VLEAIITRLGEDRVMLAGRDVTELASGQRLLVAAYEQTAEVRATLQTALEAITEAFAVYDVLRDEEFASALSWAWSLLLPSPLRTRSATH